MTKAIDEAFLRAVPKSDLHVHLDGSLRVTTLVELAQEHHVKLPSYTESGLRDLVFKPRYANLSEYLHGFAYTLAVMQTEAALERIAFELAVDNQEEGVRYLEVRFAPQLHVHDTLNIVMVLRAANRGLERARDLYNRRPEILSGSEPPFAYGIIVCAMRMFRTGSSQYFTNLLRAHRYAPPKEVFRHASLELARAAASARDEYELPIVGFDLAGEESGYPAVDHIDAYALAQKKFLRKTVHAGESYGPESIFQAITDLQTERIGHGTYLLEPDAITDPAIVDREHYVQQLGQFIADRRITLEICLTSNLQTNPQITDIGQHTFARLRQHRLSTAICTDNRLISNTKMTRELGLAVQAGNMD